MQRVGIGKIFTLQFWELIEKNYPERMDISPGVNISGLQVVESEDTDASFRDAVDTLSTTAQPDETGNDYDESWGMGEMSSVRSLLTDPNPRVLLALLCLPYLLLIYNSISLGVSLYRIILDLLFYWGYMTVFVLAILTTVKLYCQRQQLLEWAVRLLYYYNGSVLSIGLDDSRRCVGVQTVDNDFQRQVDVLRNNHFSDMRRIRKHIHQMRKKFSQRVRDLKDLAKERNDILTKLQLRFPEMEHEKDTLVAERDAIEKQLEEEKRRNKELIGRFQRISQQFSRLGHAQYPPPLMSLDFHGHQLQK